MNITVNGVSYYLTQHQQKSSLPYILLLHGFMGSGKSFNHLIPELTTYCNPVTLDLLGHGKTDNPKNFERYELKHQLSDLYEIIKFLDHSRLFLHGYSMGGRLALQFAVKHPNLISGLIIESSNYGIEKENQKKQRLELDEERAKFIEDDYENFLDKWQKLPLFDSGIPVGTELKQFYRKIQKNQNPNAIARSLRGFGVARMPSVKHCLHQLDMPTLLLAGERDPKYQTILDQMDDRISNSKFHIIRNAGHRIHLENPRALLDQLKAFIFSYSCNC